MCLQNLEFIVLTKRATALDLRNSESSLRGCDIHSKKVQVGNDQEKAQSERDPHSKNRGGKKPN